MLIDIGADDKEDVANIGVRPGDTIVPVTPFEPMANEKRSWQKLGIIATAAGWLSSF